MLCRYWCNKKETVEQYIIPESLVPAVLLLVHDAVIAGHPGQERTLNAARTNYYWPSMRIDIDAHIDRCVKCAQNKATVSRPAPILEYPPPEQPWDVVAIDVLTLPASHQGSCTGNGRSFQ